MDKKIKIPHYVNLNDDLKMYETLHNMDKETLLERHWIKLDKLRNYFAWSVLFNLIQIIIIIFMYLFIVTM